MNRRSFFQLLFGGLAVIGAAACAEPAGAQERIASTSLARLKRRRRHRKRRHKRKKKS